MEGEDEDSENPRAFNNAKIWKRMIVIIAGAVMNILFGLVLMMITLLPKPYFAGTEVTGFGQLSFSSVSDLQVGDKIVDVGGYAVNTYTDLSFAISTLPVTEVDGNDFIVYKEDCATDLFNYASQNVTEKTDNDAITAVVKMLYSSQDELRTADDRESAYKIFCKYYKKISKELGVKTDGKYPVIEFREKRQRYRTDMTVMRDGERIVLHDIDLLTLKSDNEDKPTIQQDFTVNPIEKNFGTVLSSTFTETISVVRMVWTGLAGLVTGKFSLNDMSGPIGIASAITEVASESLKTSGFGTAVMSIVFVMMIITINLGIINMLPFPALDGGRFLMLLIEAIFHKPVPRKVESIINTTGLVLLLGLSAVIAVMDVIKLIRGG